MSAGSILVISNKIETSKELAAILLHSGFSSAEVAISANEARRRINQLELELIVINAPLPDEDVVTLVLDISEKVNASILVIVKRELLSDVQYQLEKCGALVLSKPLEKSILIQTARFAVNANKSLANLRNENDKLKQKMDDKKLVDKAKWYLIENLKMSEPQAHRYIQKRAMDLRLPQKDIAQEIIKSYE
jgi:AmiR/NasT family two-component response regulator